ncbi:hypothetical protein G6F46_002465 [Rhizopus delemar]|uniref:Uncharacterized protein n=2 Tax=Rhizopus TaxID=4842 RepID=A0A9P6ZDI8_9FUNG|nr:hypothetical protein G6F55_009372 [Rhizopus delemar]KAG1552977.1 hypothetical protein G6F51_000884 [Rhizopus arrhizus]KAG1503143.1 hypothetical protein G6F54_001880 [Rhizopus delemar]KAG1516578.1 hypothetical protein G6F53_002051 [Rhizopus delemar]KAG1520287.1 hypothetical protein G6F52_007805 [Rhizopus delemar]
MVPITPHLQYPWHPNPLGVDDNLEKSLRESHERERYLERIIQSQANQLKEPTVQNALNTLENIYLYNQNELKIHHSNQVDKLKSQLNILSRKKDKLDVILNHLNRLESTNENDDDWSVKDRKSLLRKLRLNELRLAVKNVELEALVHKQNNDHPPTNNNLTNLSLLADKLLQQDHHKRLLDEEDDNHRKRYKLTTEKHWTEKEDELLLGLIQKSASALHFLPTKKVPDMDQLPIDILQPMQHGLATDPSPSLPNGLVLVLRSMALADDSSCSHRQERFTIGPR